MITTRIEKMIGQEYLFVEVSEQDFIRIRHVKITKNEFSGSTVLYNNGPKTERRDVLYGYERKTGILHNVTRQSLFLNMTQIAEEFAPKFPNFMAGYSNRIMQCVDNHAKNERKPGGCLDMNDLMKERSFTWRDMLNKKKEGLASIIKTVVDVAFEDVRKCFQTNYNLLVILYKKYGYNGLCGFCQQHEIPADLLNNALRNYVEKYYKSQERRHEWAKKQASENSK